MSYLYLTLTVIAAAFASAAGFGGTGGHSMNYKLCAAPAEPPMIDSFMIDTSTPDFVQPDMGFSGGLQVVEFGVYSATAEHWTAVTDCMTMQPGVRQFFVAIDGNFAQVPGGSLIMQGYDKEESFTMAMAACMEFIAPVMASLDPDAPHPVALLGDVEDFPSVASMFWDMGANVMSYGDDYIGYFHGPSNFILDGEGRVERTFVIVETSVSPIGQKAAFEEQTMKLAAGHYRPGATQWFAMEVPCPECPPDTGTYMSFATNTYERMFTEDRWTTYGPNQGQDFMNFMWYGTMWGPYDFELFPAVVSIFSLPLDTVPMLNDVINMYDPSQTSVIEYIGKPFIYTGEIPFPQGLHLWDSITVTSEDEMKMFMRMVDLVSSKIIGLTGVRTYTAFMQGGATTMYLMQNYKDLASYYMAVEAAEFEVGVVEAFMMAHKMDGDEHYWAGDDLPEGTFPTRDYRVATGFFYNENPLHADDSGGWIQIEYMSIVPEAVDPPMEYPEITKYALANFYMSDDISFISWVFEPNGLDFKVISGYVNHAANGDKDSVPTADTGYLLMGMGVDSLLGLDWNYGTSTPIMPDTDDRWRFQLNFYGYMDSPGFAQFTGFFGEDRVLREPHEMMSGFIWPGQWEVLGKVAEDMEPMCVELPPL